MSTTNDMIFYNFYNKTHNVFASTRIINFDEYSNNEMFIRFMSVIREMGWNSMDHIIAVPDTDGYKYIIWNSLEGHEIPTLSIEGYPDVQIPMTPVRLSRS
jgi:hypothetical protein